MSDNISILIYWFNLFFELIEHPRISMVSKRLDLEAGMRL